MDTSYRWLLLASVLEFGLLWLRGLGDLRRAIPETIAIWAFLSSFYLIAILVGSWDPPAGGWRWFLPAAAVLFRLTMWSSPPSLSDDVFRYRWEGMVSARGGNPYQVRPSDMGWTTLRDEAFPRVGQKDFRAGYGPLIEQAQLWMYLAAERITPDPIRQAFLFKFPGALFDLGILALLWRLLPPARFLVYAWSPLAIVEFWGSGHNDSIPLLLILLAIAGANARRWGLSFTALSLAVAAKIWPLALFPIFVWRSGEERWKAWALAPVFALAWLPYWSDVRENVRFMTGFAGGWRNNDSLFGVLLWLTRGDAAAAKYTAFALAGIAVTYFATRDWPIEKSCLGAIAALLMVSANCHPWYLTWLLPFLAFHLSAPLLLWIGLIPLAYEVVIRWTILGEWEGLSPLRWYIHAPVYAYFAVLGVLALARRLRGSTSAAYRAAIPRVTGTS